MKKVSKLLRYLGDYKPQIALYFLCILLAVLFGLFSFSMLGPVLQVLFIGEQKLPASGNIIAKITSVVNDVIIKEDKLTALTYTVAVVVAATILKNTFVYLALSILNPLRNAVIRRLRDDMFTKTLSLPIGFFTEERKGDLISRMTNDVNEIEQSIMNMLETFIREPLTVLFTLVSMVIMSPQLTLFLLLFLPITGIIIGRIGKSLKKPSNLAQEQLGHMLGVIDETLAGLRVVKAFNAEKHQHLRFSNINNTLFRLRNRISARRELGSPLSETMGVIVVSIILWYGGRLIFSGDTSLTGPWFIAYIALFYTLINPLKNLSSAIYNVQKGVAALERVEHLLDAENTIKELPSPKSLPAFNTALEF